MTAPQQSDVQHHHQPPAAVPPSGGAFEDATSALAVVRLATPADAPTITAFNQATAWETESIRIPDDVARAGVDAMLLPGGEAQGNAWMYVLEVPGQGVVGQLMITKEWSDWRAGWFWWIQSVYVRPDARGAGHFKQLYAHARAEAERQGAEGLRLYVDDDNTNAQGVYKRLGMTSHYRVFEDLLGK